MALERHADKPALLESQDLLERLAAIVEREKLTDLVCNGPTNCYGQSVEAAEMHPVVPLFHDVQSMRSELAELALNFGVSLNLANPLAELVVRHAKAGRMRIHIVLGSGLCEQPLLSVRRHPVLPAQIHHLEALGFLTSAQRNLLAEMMRLQGNFLIAGRTGSGKTTLLAAMLHSMSGRTILLEETPEIELPPPSLSLTQRKANSEGRGEITIQRLLIESLRMRPDRVVVGEVRGIELATLLQALNNGHRGSGATLHAASPELTVQRLLLLGMIAGLQPELTMRLVAGGVDFVVQLGLVDGKRRVVEITRPRLSDGLLSLEPIGASSDRAAA